MRGGDLANGQTNSGHIDAFLTSPDCVRLFDGPYNGAASSPLCRIYIGPVTAGTASGRQTLPKGMYRVFVQAWASNELSNVFGVDVGLYTDQCRPNFMAP
jgi:hypothetical protein